MEKFRNAFKKVQKSPEPSVDPKYVADVIRLLQIRDKTVKTRPSVTVKKNPVNTNSLSRSTRKSKTTSPAQKPEIHGNVKDTDRNQENDNDSSYEDVQSEHEKSEDSSDDFVDSKANTKGDRKGERNPDDPPGYPSKDDGVNKILGFSQETLNMFMVESCLRKAESGNRFGEKLMDAPPVLPKGGQILLYRCNKIDDLEHHKDQYFKWKDGGSNKHKNQNVLKKYYSLCDEGNYNLPFRRYTYELTASSGKADKVVMMHYVGDEAVYRPHSHGNAKSGKVFVPNTSAVKAQIRSHIISSNGKPQRVFEDVTKQAAERADFEDREAVNAPSNRKQVENIKYNVEKSKHILRCEIFATFEMGRNKTLGSFILRHVVNPYHVVIMAEPAALKLANSLLKSAMNDPSIPQNMTYDTTFDLTSQYVSALVMKNTYVVGNPIFAVAYMIHERKFKEVHNEFFHTMREFLDLQALESNVPIVADREAGIRWGILREFPDCNFIVCSNHLIRDLKRWVKKHGGKQDDVKVYSMNIKALLACEEEEEFQEKYEEYKDKWSEAFVIYMESKLYDDVKNKCSRFAIKKFEAFRDIAVTSNNSETFNSVLKKSTSGEEQPVDTLVLTLFNQQLNKLHDFARAYKRNGVGNCMLKAEYRNHGCPFELPSYALWKNEKFIEYFKDEVYKPGENIEKEGFYRQSRIGMAKMACESNLVSLDSRSGVFIVTGLYNGKRAIVHRHDGGTLVCDCPSTGYCYHKLAVLYSIRMEIEPDRDTYNLNVLMKRGRGGKKTGKKKPLPGDYDINFDAAADSQAKKQASQGNFNDTFEIDKHLETVDTSAASDSDDPQVISSTLTINNINSSDCSDGDTNNDFLLHHYDNAKTGQADNLQTKRTSLGTRSTASDPETPDWILVESTPKQIPQSWYDSNYQSLKPNMWLADDVVNDMTSMIIKVHGLENRVAFINSREFRTMQRGNLHHYVTNAIRCEGLNSDVLIVNILTDNHYFFAIILYRAKKIILVNSMWPHAPDVNHVFPVLLKLVAATYFVAFVQFDASEWGFLIEQEVQIQENSYDCGIHVVYNQFAMFRRRPFPDGEEFPDTNSLRRWIMHVLHQPGVASPIRLRPKHIPRVMAKDKKEVENLLQNLVTPEITPIGGSFSSDIIAELRSGTQLLRICASKNCVQPDDEDGFTYLMCVCCRQWYHLGSCVPASKEAVEYYVCNDCTKNMVLLTTSAGESGESRK